MSDILVRSAVAVLFLAGLAIGTGFLVAPVWGWSVFSLGLIGLLVHHVRHLRLLRRWASSSLTEAVPEGTGAWEEVFTLLYRRQRAETARSRQLAHCGAGARAHGDPLVPLIRALGLVPLRPVAIAGEAAAAIRVVFQLE